MEEFDRLLACLPAAPDFRYDWAGLCATALAPVFRKMAKTPQHPEWHGEGDVFTHTKMVCEALAQISGFRALAPVRQQELALAALLHDTGKITCTRLEDGRWTSPGHASAGAQEVRRLLWQEYGLCGDTGRQNFRETVCLLIRRHTLPLHLMERRDTELTVRKLAANGTLAKDFCLQMLFLLAEADVRGRICSDAQQLLDEIRLGEELASEAGCLYAPFAFASGHTAHAYFAGRSVYQGQALYDDTWGEVILMCGLPGTGKDTWIAAHHPELPVVCLDDIRRRMGVSPEDEQGRVVQAAKEEARGYLRAKQPFIWNATGLTPLIRRKQISLFEEYHASVRAVYLETGWQENLRRNAERIHAVPEAVVDRMLHQLVPPEAAEARRVEWICV